MALLKKLSRVFVTFFKAFVLTPCSSANSLICDMKAAPSLGEMRNVKTISVSWWNGSSPNLFNDFMSVYIWSSGELFVKWNEDISARPTHPPDHGWYVLYWRTNIMTMRACSLTSSEEHPTILATYRHLKAWQPSGIVHAASHEGYRYSRVKKITKWFFWTTMGFVKIFLD